MQPGDLNIWKPVSIQDKCLFCRCNAERQKAQAERAELEEFQKTQQELRERELEERIRAETRNPSVVVRHHARYAWKLENKWFKLRHESQQRSQSPHS